MTNKGATVKLTEKQRETLDRLARDLGYGYVGLSFVRPNTWRSLVAAGLVQECVTERGMFKLTEQGCAAAGVKPTYMSNVRNAEAFAVIEHLRRGNDSAMRTAEAANLRDSQVLLDPHLKRIGVVGTELVNGRTRLWTVDLDEPDQSPKWVDATPEMMNVVFACAEGRPAPVYMRRADEALLFRVLGTDNSGRWPGVHLVAASDDPFTLELDVTELADEGWIATDHTGLPQFRPTRCPAGSSCTGAAFPGHPAHAIESDGVDEILHLIDNPPTAKELADRRNVEALEGVLEGDEGYHVIGEVSRGKPAVEGVTSSYWVVPTTGDRLTDRHDVLGPYADLDMAQWKRDQYIEAGHPCRVLQSVTRPTPFAAGDQVVQLDGTPAEVFEVVGETVFARTADGEVYEHEADELSLLDPDDPRGRPKTPDELAEDARGLEQQRLEAAQKSTDPTVRAFYGVDTPPRVVTMTLAEYIASVAVTVSAVRRAAMLQERAGC